MTTETDLTTNVVIGEQPSTPPAPAADDQNAGEAKAETEAKPEGDAESKAQESEKSDDTEQQQDEQKKSRFQRRLERQKEGRIRAETEARMLREQLAALEGRGKDQQPKDAGEPKRENFDSYEDYIEAKAVYKAELKVAERLEQSAQKAQQQGDRSREAAEQQKIATRWNTVEAEFSKSHKDYETVVTPFVEDELGSFSDPARRAIVESDVGPQVLYHLANNVEEAERIANLSPTQQVKELGKLELKLSIPAKDKSKAPQPPSHERGNRNAANGYSDNMSDSEYREWRKSQGARWARG